MRSSMVRPGVVMILGLVLGFLGCRTQDPGERATPESDGTGALVTFEFAWSPDTMMVYIEDERARERIRAHIGGETATRWVVGGTVRHGPGADPSFPWHLDPATYVQFPLPDCEIEPPMQTEEEVEALLQRAPGWCSPAVPIAIEEPVEKPF